MALRTNLVLTIIILAYSPILCQWTNSSSIVQLNSGNRSDPVAISPLAESLSKGKLYVGDNPNVHFNDWLVYLRGTSAHSTVSNRGAILTIQGDAISNEDPVLLQGLPGSTSADPSFRMSYKGVGTFKSKLNLNYTNPTAGKAIEVGGDEALWYNDDYFSWGYGAKWNRFADPMTIGSATKPSTGVGLRIDGDDDLKLVGGGIQFDGAGGVDFINNTGNSIYFRDAGNTIISQLRRGTNFFRISDLTQLILSVSNTDLLKLVGISRTVELNGDVKYSDSHDVFWGANDLNQDITLKRSGDDFRLINRTGMGAINAETQGGDVHITNTEATVFLKGENVGINTVNPQHALHVSGDVGITGEFYALSDVRVKKDVSNIEDALSIVQELRPAQYHYDQTLEELHLPNNRQYGLIAQELGEVLPELITAHSMATLDNAENDEQLLGVNYNALISILLKAVQEQSDIISGQNETIGDLQGKMNVITQQLAQLSLEVANKNSGK